MARFWADMTGEDFEAVDPETWVAVLPVAAIEQHGPHLPVSVDADINAGILAEALKALPEDAPIVILPPLPVGKSQEHIAFRGTLSLSTNTLMALWTDIAESVLRAGFRKLVLFNSHGGQPQVVELVARDLRVRHGMFVVSCLAYGLGRLDHLFSAHELRHGIHGGEAETSMMLHLRPDVVKRDKFQHFVTLDEELAAEGYKHLRADGAAGMGWMTQDINPMGAAGDVRNADAGRGREALELAGQAVAEMFLEASRFPLERLAAPTIAKAAPPHS